MRFLSFGVVFNSVWTVSTDPMAQTVLNTFSGLEFFGFALYSLSLPPLFRLLGASFGSCSQVTPFLRSRLPDVIWQAVETHTRSVLKSGAILGSDQMIDRAGDSRLDLSGGYPIRAIK